MTSLDHGHPSDEAASRRKVLLAGLFKASTLAPLRNTKMAARAPRPAGRVWGFEGRAASRRRTALRFTSRSGARDGLSFSVMAGRSMPMFGTIR